MSKIKNFSRVGWVVVGLVAAMLLVPTMAVAATVTYNGIEGTNGTTPTQNKADVTSAGQLLTTEAQPNDYFYADTAPGNGFDAAVVSPPVGTALIMTVIHVNVFGNPHPGSDSQIDLFVAPNADCNTGAGPYFQPLNETGLGEQAVSLAPGIAVPSGDDLCAGEFGSLEARVDVSGYSVPASDVASAPVHALPEEAMRG